MPCQEEALNDLSSIPPVSVTMQPRNLPVVVPPVPLELLEPPDGVPADPQPAASSVTALATVTAIIDFLNSDLLNEGSTVLPQRPPGSTQTPASPGTNVIPPSWDCPKASPAIRGAKGAPRSSSDADAKLRRLTDLEAGVTDG